MTIAPQRRRMAEQRVEAIIGTTDMPGFEACVQAEMAIKERPILFTTPMIRALLAGTKRQTRRIVKPQPTIKDGVFRWDTGRKSGFLGVHTTRSNDPSETMSYHCPYGNRGDRLWVRETFAYNCANPERFGQDSVIYCATAQVLSEPKWKPSIFMPRWASRITLEITNVRVERLADISEKDAGAEGMKRCPNMNGRHGITGWVWPESPYDKSGLCHSSAYKAFQGGWDNLNGDGSWEQNPWVWVLEFKRVRIANG